MNEQSFIFMKYLDTKSITFSLYGYKTSYISYAWSDCFIATKFKTATEEEEEEEYIMPISIVCIL